MLEPSTPLASAAIRRPWTGPRVFNVALGGWTALVLTFLYAPILVLVIYSFNSARLNIVWEGFTLQWYREVWAHASLMRALENSLIIATITTFASVVLGTMGAWALHRHRGRGSELVQTMVGVPIVMPEIIMGVSLLVMFATVGIPLGFTTVIIAHITFCFPFVLVAVQARLAALDPVLEEAALDLGATPWRAFWLVIVPSLRPAILAGALMAFTLSLAEGIVTYFTASPAAATLPLRIFGMAKVGIHPMLNALSTLFILATLAVAIFSARLRQLR